MYWKSLFLFRLIIPFVDYTLSIRIDYYPSHWFTNIRVSRINTYIFNIMVYFQTKLPMKRIAIPKTWLFCYKESHTPLDHNALYKIHITCMSLFNQILLKMHRMKNFIGRPFLSKSDIENETANQSRYNRDETGKNASSVRM